MIYLQQGQDVAENEDLVVYDATGDYNDNDMVICAKRETPNEPYCRFEAQFIAYGGIVYAISEEEKLLEEIQKIDPETTLAEETNDSMIEQQEDVSTRPTEDTPKQQQSEPDPTEEIPTEETVMEETVPEVVPETAPEIIPEPVAEQTPETVIEPEIITEPLANDTLEVVPEIIPPAVDISDSAGMGAQMTGNIQ